MSEILLTFEEAISSIQALFKHHIQQIDELDKYFTWFCNEVNGMAPKLEKISSPPNYVGTKPEQTNLRSKWEDIVYTKMNPSKAAGVLSVEINELLTKTIKTMKDYYSGHQTAILQAIKPALTAYNSAKKAKKSTYADYQKAAETGKNFQQKQNEALAAHNKYNQAKIEFTTAMEQFYTDFEILEVWRYGQYQMILLRFANAYEQFANVLRTSSLEAKQKLNAISLDTDTDAFTESLNQIRDVLANEDFQIIPVNGLQSKYINLKKLFKDDFKKYKLMQLSESFSGVKDQLCCQAQEIVFLMESQGQYSKCKTINGCIGLIPTRILVPAPGK